MWEDGICNLSERRSFINTQLTLLYFTAFDYDVDYEIMVNHDEP